MYITMYMCKFIRIPCNIYLSSCGKDACPCHFCGWCLSDCGDSDAAHAHVASCSHKPPGADEFFGTMKEFNIGA